MRLGPYMVPTRTMVYVLFYRMHNNRNLWHKPEEFLPERWAEQEDPEKHSTTPAADAGATVAAGLGKDILARNEKKYLPFSEGPRGCLGQVVLMIRRSYLTCCRPSKHCAWQLHELSVPADTLCDVFLSPNAPWHSNEAANLYILEPLSFHRHMLTSRSLSMQRLAIMEIKVALAVLCQHFTFELCHPAEVTHAAERMALTLHVTGGIMLHCRPRQPRLLS